MLARLFGLLPFSLSVPEGEQFPIYEYSMRATASGCIRPGEAIALPHRKELTR